MARALVLGLGESGLAIARWLARAGWQLRVADTRPEPPGLEALRRELPDAEFRPGPFSPELLDGASLLALSPGLSPRDPAVHGLLALASARSVEAVGEIELFARALAALRAERGYAPQVLGVTGTNGKTTTVRMLGRMFERAGRSVRVAGNVSPSALDALREALDTERLPEAWVLELSSFQLATTTSLACTAAAVLNLTQDHLDWHADMDDYAAAKRRVFGTETVRVLARDDERVLAMQGPGGRGTRVLTFGRGAPEAPGQYGLVRDAGLVWLAWVEEEELPRRRRRTPRPAPGALEAPPAPSEPLVVHRLMPTEALAARGTHFALDALAALALAHAAGLPLAPALRALGEFRPDPHRTETVARIGGIEFVDDSKGTNVGATVAALQGLDEAPSAARRIVVILGGDGKGQDFAPLAEAVRRHARAAVLLGRDAPRIAEALAGSDVPVERADDLPAAVRAAAARARPGDIVLLSPACASFDMFRNYAHRGQVFADAVRALASGPVAGGAA